MSATVAPAALLLDPVERGDPAGREVGEVAGAEEQLAPGEQVVVVLVPADARPGPEGVGDPRLTAQRGQREQERPRQVDRAGGVGEREGLLLAHRERAGLRLVAHVAAGGLAAQPLGEVAGVAAGALGQLLGGGRALSQRRVEAESVPDHHPAGRQGGAQVSYHAAHELHQLVGVDGHAGAPSPGLVGAGCCCTRPRSRAWGQGVAGCFSPVATRLQQRGRPRRRPAWRAAARSATAPSAAAADGSPGRRPRWRRPARP